MHLAFLILCKSAVSSAHPSKSKPAAVKVMVASWPVGVIPRIVTASPPHMSHGGRSSVKIFPIMHDNSAPLQAHRVNIRSVATPRSKRPLRSRRRLCGVPCCGNLDKAPPSYPMKAQCTDCLYSPSSNKFCGVRSSQQPDCRAWNIVRKDNPSIARSLHDTRATRPNCRTVQPMPSRLPPPFGQ